MSKLNIILNRQIVTGFKGETILELARRHGIEIPTLCHDDRLEPFSSCYVCVVEVEGMRGLQPACSTRIAEGMRIQTDNEKVKKSRKMALDLLVSNHYADCVAPCQETCPAGVDVQGYIAMVNRGMHREAVRLIKQTNPLPAICGRVCVRPCELACRRNLVEGVGVGIDYLKRYTSDIDLFSDRRFMPDTKPPSGKKVAVIGAGPGGLTAAYYLAIEGHQAEIYEASPHAGGMLRYGIPPYRLPNDIIEKEVEGITGLGVHIHYEKKLGDNLSYADLKKDHHAMILAIGSQSGTRIGCENDDAGNIFSGIDFLRNMEMTAQKYDFSGKTVAVIGGGNTAMDCCRTARRCGAEKVIVLYRRTEKEMPANPIEIHESKLEGIEYMFLTAPARVNPGADGNVDSITCFRMQLGEPDASGRRRPVKIEGSEFGVKVDYILAAIGQKTVVNFMEDIGRHADQPLELNKWGDIDAHPDTLQTSISNVFACGDGVTGPATLIEAIAQGKVAARSCHQFLTDQPIVPDPGEFLSKKDHFAEQQGPEYENLYEKQDREEMPTLDPVQRNNFDEVELGYPDKSALKESLRCMECGCSELYTCDLKKHATTYQADQDSLMGTFNRHALRFDHPFVEIDNNKCILCSRCIRICSEVVGANALGLINRGFDTYVAPSMDQELAATRCESCGMCIDTCPTGAITENVAFKPAPVQGEEVHSICHYCSVGCAISLHHQSGFFHRVTGRKGLVNQDGSICRYAKFGYRYLNDPERITRPLLKVNGSFTPIEHDRAITLIAERIRETAPDRQAFYAGARLTNEEIYLIQKLARAGAGTNNVGSFYYMDRRPLIPGGKSSGLSFDDIRKADRIVLLGSEINLENAVPGFYAFNRRFTKGVPLEVVTTQSPSTMAHKASRLLTIRSYPAFIQAVIYHILKNKLENKVYIDAHCEGFEAYREQVLAADFKALLDACGCSAAEVGCLAESFNKDHRSILIASEKHLGPSSVRELNNLMMMLGKSSKTASGLILLKEKNNAQGLIDMGAFPHLAPGRHDISLQATREKLRELWKTSSLPEVVLADQWSLLRQGKVQQAFIFGEDPLGCALQTEETAKALKGLDFLMVQDAFMSDTARQADLIMPASLPFETGGSFTNSQQYIQSFDAVKACPTGMDNGSQLTAILQALGVHTNGHSPAETLLESATLMEPAGDKQESRYVFEHGENEKPWRHFDHGCDVLNKRFDEKWESAFNKS